MKTSTKSKPKKTKEKFYFEVNGTSFCCGLQEVGDMYTSKLHWGKDWNGTECWLNEWNERVWDRYANSDDEIPGVACIACTSPEQKEEAIQLAKRGFKHILTWTGTHRTNVKLWFKPPNRQKLRLAKKDEKPIAKKAKVKK